MLAMFKAMAAEVWWLLIDSQDLRGLGSGMFASQAPPHNFPPEFLHFTWVGTALENKSNAEGIPWMRWKHP